MIRPLLLVDDNHDLRAMLSELLELYGFAVDAVGSAEEAIERMQRGPLPSLVILDLMMPGMSGQDFCIRRATHPEMATVPVIVLSARPCLGDPVLDGIRQLQKPIDIHHLLGEIRAVLGVPDRKSA